MPISTVRATTPAPTPSMDTRTRSRAAFTGGRTGTPALIEDTRTVTHDELADLVEDFAARLPDAGTGRRLVHLSPTADVTGIVGYLATLAAGHVALVTDTDASGSATITSTFGPDLRVERAGHIEVLHETPQHLLHPDLALLLSTSGSTGSPKLVRLSHDNLVTNADAIAHSLGLDENDRAITSLPLHYCYGLSWVHALLRAGGGLVLTDESVTSDRFWQLLDASGTTVLGGVPHTFDLIDERLDEDHPGLRLLTQAGGAMAPDRVRQLAERGRRRGWQLAVMYGQTEATARMAVLPGTHSAAFPDAVGWAVEDSTFRLDHDVPGGTDEIGELVFSGPGVMLGYAEHPDDLALGRMVSELRTRDLGRVDPDGLVRIVGRRDAVAKVMGLRIDLTRVEAALAAEGHDAVVTADAQRLLVAVVSALPDGSDAARARRVAAQAAGLAPAGVLVAEVDALPRLSNGKTDRAGCRALVARSAGPVAAGRGDRLARVTGIVADALGRDDIDADQSFAQLGGDSYSVVQTSLQLERVVGALPTGWHRLPLRSLVAGPPAAHPLVSRVETSVVLRALAVIAICASHIGIIAVPGGAHSLLAIAGWSMSRFTLDTPRPTERWRRGVRSLTSLALPSMLVALTVLLLGGGYGIANVFLVNWFLGSIEWGPRIQLWFVEALLASAALTLVLLSIPRLASAYRRAPWAWAMTLGAVALVPRWILVPDATGATRGLPGSVLWIFAVGLALGVATTRRQQLLTLALAAVGLWDFFIEPSRGWTVLAALTLLALVPRLPVPRILVPLLGLLAAASLHIYLIQFQVYPHITHDGLALAASLAAGILLWRLLITPTRWVSDLLTTRREPATTPIVSAVRGGTHPNGAS